LNLEIIIIICLSVCSLTLLWVVYSLFKRMLFVSDNIDTMIYNLTQFSEHIENVNKMEMYYGDIVLQELLEHSQQVTEDIEAFQEVYQGGPNSGRQTEEKA